MRRTHQRQQSYLEYISAGLGAAIIGVSVYLAMHPGNRQVEWYTHKREQPKGTYHPSEKQHTQVPVMTENIQGVKQVMQQVNPRETPTRSMYGFENYPACFLDPDRLHPSIVIGKNAEAQDTPVTLDLLYRNLMEQRQQE